MWSISAPRRWSAWHLLPAVPLLLLGLWLAWQYLEAQAATVGAEPLSGSAGLL